jgi:hypothetical protein
MTNMKLSTNTYNRLVLITPSASLLGIAGCSNGPGGGEPVQGNTGLPGIFVSSNWSRPGPSYLYDEIALPAGGNGGASSMGPSGSSSGGHSGGSSSGGGGASSGGSSFSAGNDLLPQDGLASKTGIREATFIPSKSDFLLPISQRCPRSFLMGKTTRVVSSLSGPSAGVRLSAPCIDPLEDVRKKTKFMRLLTIKI